MLMEDMIARSFGAIIGCIIGFYLLSKLIEWLFLNRILKNYSAIVWISSVLIFDIIAGLWFINRHEASAFHASYFVYYAVAAIALPILRNIRHKRKVSKDHFSKDRAAPTKLSDFPTEDNQNGFVVGGILFPKPPQSESDFVKMLTEIGMRLVAKLPTKQDQYWFVIEEYGNLSSYGPEVMDRLNFPFALYEIEYEGRKSENSYVGAPNPGILYLDEEYMPAIIKQYGQKNAELWRGLLFATFCTSFKAEIEKLRMDYAVHYHNNCISNGSLGYADKWNSVILSLGGE